ncbi:hypothetical protein T12_3103 [Trichinella patagoniensis]|uniref:Uncharacterized protein n=1 Tax=Trichinella patagoniensis TaxID=990121 RepID=A0A0V0YSH0_9BILA|nr:hypothetical protein T12_3103 [Trichinella patagoniensis]
MACSLARLLLLSNNVLYEIFGEKTISNGLRLLVNTVT